MDPKSRSTTSSTELNMVFDFFKQRAEEGMDELAKFVDDANKNFEAFADGLAKSRNKFLYDLEAIFDGNGDIFEQLEDVLLQADLGLKTTQEVIDEIRSLREDSTEIFSRDDLRSVLRGKLIETLTIDEESNAERKFTRGIQFAQKEGDLTVLFVMGANGMGKTTTIGKLAARLRIEGEQKVMVAACDTFRAGAVEQLEMWANRAEVSCYTPSEERKSPSAVLYGALEQARNEKYDTLIVDTSGRLSNNDALNQELLKMKRVIQKYMSTQRDEDNKPIPNLTLPHEILLVIDAAQGRMALDSAKQWDDLLQLSGLVLTKLDGSAKGGSVVAVWRELGVPVKLVGVGEGIEDLRDFEAESFVDGLLGIGAAGGQQADESKQLEQRLIELRKARDDRAKVSEAASSKNSGPGMQMPAGMPGMGGLPDMTSMGQEDDSQVRVITPTGPKKPARRKGVSKKKKKRGRR